MMQFEGAGIAMVDGRDLPYQVHYLTKLTLPLIPYPTKRRCRSLWTWPTNWLRCIFRGGVPLYSLPRVLKQVCWTAITKNSATLRYPVPRLSAGRGSERSLAGQAWRRNDPKLLHQARRIHIEPVSVRPPFPTAPRGSIVWRGPSAGQALQPLVEVLAPALW